MTTKVKGTGGIEFPDATVQSSAAYTKAESNAMSNYGPAFIAAGTPFSPPLGTTQITFTESVDTDNCFAANRFTPNVAGLYQINLSIDTNLPAAAPSGGVITKMALSLLRRSLMLQQVVGVGI